MKEKSLKSSIQSVQNLMKLGEFDIYAIKKFDDVQMVDFFEYKESVKLSENLILSTFPPHTENPSNLFSHYRDCKNDLSSMLESKEYIIILVTKNEVKKLNDFEQISELIKDKIIYN